uniref:Uncharacterized protein n=1 Tax=Arundo donax TaxID=35708 RepID=A0A0A9G3N5_ARUDO
MNNLEPLNRRILVLIFFSFLRKDRHPAPSFHLLMLRSTFFLILEMMLKSSVVTFSFFQYAKQFHFIVYLFQ